MLQAGGSLAPTPPAGSPHPAPAARPPAAPLTRSGTRTRVPRPRSPRPLTCAPPAAITSAAPAGSSSAPAHWPRGERRRGAHWLAGGSGGESGVRRAGTRPPSAGSDWLEAWSEDSETAPRGQ